MSMIKKLHQLLDDQEMAAHKFVAEVKHRYTKLLFDPMELIDHIQKQRADNQRFFDSVIAAARLLGSGPPIPKVEVKKIECRVLEVGNLWVNATLLVESMALRIET